jgi:hypothetical protein
MARQALEMRYQMPSLIPPESSTMLVHLRAENLALADGSAVASLADAATGDSFNGGVAQGAAAQRPTLRAAALNGRKVIEFDGNDHLISSATNSLSDAGDGMTIFLVATGDRSGQTAQRAAQVGSSGGGGGRVAGLDVSGETGLRFNNGAAVYDAGLVASDFHIMVFRIGHGQSYADATIFIDGTMPQNTFTGSSNNLSSLVNFTGSDLELILGTGRLSNGGLAASDYYTGSFAEFLLYNEQLSELQINLVANYLSSEYALPFAYDTSTAVPEPAAALGAGVVILCLARRRRAPLDSF